MNVRSLTQGQQRAIDALVTSGALQGVPPDLAKAARFLEQASEALGEVVDLRVPSVIYDIAYNAAHDVGEAMLAAYGYRTASGAGQHVAVGQFLEAVFDGLPAQEAARRYDRSVRPATPFATARNPSGVPLRTSLWPSPAGSSPVLTPNVDLRSRTTDRPASSRWLRPGGRSNDICCRWAGGRGGFVAPSDDPAVQGASCLSHRFR